MQPDQYQLMMDEAGLQRDEKGEDFNLPGIATYRYWE